MIKKFVVFVLAIFLAGCAPLAVKKGSKPLGKLNLGKTQVEIEGEYSGNIYSPTLHKESLGKMNIGGSMRELK